MIFLILVSILSVILSRIRIANGQCTVDNCRKYASETNENLQESIQKLEQMCQNMLSRIVRMEERFEVLEKLSQRGNTTVAPVFDCSDIWSSGNAKSGSYRVYVDHEQKRYYKEAYCDFTNGNWTVFQRRKDGSEDFYRGWTDYANGFGSQSGEFWLGNDFIHLLTSKRRYRLRIDLEDFEGNGAHAEYSSFSISSSADKYRLRIGTYSGNAGDSLSYHTGNQFSTKDADNDDYSSGSCAVGLRGAWWYNSCHNSNLNGIYKRGNYSDCSRCGIDWLDWRGWQYSLKTTEMKISPVA